MRSAAIDTLLPEVFRRVNYEGTPLRAVLDAMEEMHTPAEKVLEDIDSVFSFQRCDEAMLPMLAHWVNLDRLFPQPLSDDESPWQPRVLPTEPGHLRNLVAKAASLSRRRGTESGLIMFLTTATGQPGFAVEYVTREGERNPIPFHIKIRAPAAAAPRRELIARIIEQEKPAYVTYELEFGAAVDGEDAPAEHDNGDET